MGRNRQLLMNDAAVQGMLIVQENTKRRKEVAHELLDRRRIVRVAIEAAEATEGERVSDTVRSALRRDLRRLAEREAAHAPAKLNSVRGMYRAARIAFRNARDLESNLWRYPCGTDDYMSEVATHHRQWAESVLAYARVLRLAGA